MSNGIPGAGRVVSKQLDRKGKLMKQVGKEKSPITAWGDGEDAVSCSERSAVSSRVDAAPENVAPNHRHVKLYEGANAHAQLVPSSLPEGRRARALLLANEILPSSQNTDVGGRGGGYLTKFQVKHSRMNQKPKRFHHINSGGPDDDDGISELTSLGGAISLPPLAPPEVAAGVSKERTFSAPARSQRFEEDVLSLPNINQRGRHESRKQRNGGRDGTKGR